MHQTSTMQAPDKYEKSTIQAMLVPYYLLPITVYLLPFTVNTKMVMADGGNKYRKEIPRMDNNGYTLKKRFAEEAAEKKDTAQLLIAAVKLPTGAVEVITNTAQIATKADYYAKAYDDEFKLKTNPEVQIIGFMII